MPICTCNTPSARRTGIYHRVGAPTTPHVTGLRPFALARCYAAIIDAPLLGKREKGWGSAAWLQPLLVLLAGLSRVAASQKSRFHLGAASLWTLTQIAGRRQPRPLSGWGYATPQSRRLRPVSMNSSPLKLPSSSRRSSPRSSTRRAVCNSPGCSLSSKLATCTLRPSKSTLPLCWAASFASAYVIPVGLPSCAIRGSLPIREAWPIGPAASVIHRTSGDGHYAKLNFRFTAFSEIRQED